jgi:hypothetical protein
MALPLSRHIQIPFFAEARSSGNILLSQHGPSGAAAQICAAVPILISLLSSDVEPTVCLQHPGNKQNQPARFAIWLTVFGEKSSLFFQDTGRVFEHHCSQAEAAYDD